MQRGSMMFYPNLLRNNLTNLFTTYSRGTSVFFFFKKNFEKKKKTNRQGAACRASRPFLSRLVSRITAPLGDCHRFSLQRAAGCAYFHIKMYLFPVINTRYISLSLCGTIYFYLSNTYRKEKSFAWKSISIIRSGRVRRTISIQKKAILRRIVFFFCIILFFFQSIYL